MSRNCCKNCANAKEYTGWYDHYCKGYHCNLRAEKYDCPLFIDDGEDQQEYDVPVEVGTDDINCIEKLLETKKLTDKQKGALQKLLSYYFRN